ncbi:MAG: rhodanese-like domain-containing protein [Spirochaetaceae bacterium]|nr:rhodanese-like domain-containing protein [Spirochaetaceae bacterium]
MKKILFIVLILFGVVAMLSCENNVSYKSVSMKEGLALMEKSSDYVLLDVRRPDEFAAGHIPGAIMLTNEEITKEKAEKLLSDKNQTVFVYCRSGRRSNEAAQKLADYGYTNVIEIGGILDYTGTLEF